MYSPRACWLLDCAGLGTSHQRSPSPSGSAGGGCSACRNDAHEPSRRESRTERVSRTGDPGVREEPGGRADAPRRPPEKSGALYSRVIVPPQRKTFHGKRGCTLRSSGEGRGVGQRWPELRVRAFSKKGGTGEGKMIWGFDCTDSTLSNSLSQVHRPTREKRGRCHADWSSREILLNILGRFHSKRVCGSKRMMIV